MDIILERINELEKELLTYSKLNIAELIGNMGFETLVKIHIYDLLKDTPKLNKEFERRALYFEGLTEQEPYKTANLRVAEVIQALYNNIHPDVYIQITKQSGFYEMMKSMLISVFGFNYKENKLLTPSYFIDKINNNANFIEFDPQKMNIDRYINQRNDSLGFLYSLYNTNNAVLIDIEQHQKLINDYTDLISTLKNAFSFESERLYVNDFSHIYFYCRALREFPFDSGSPHWQRLSDKFLNSKTQEDITLNSASRVLVELKRHYLKVSKIKLEIYVEQNKISYEGQEINLSEIEMSIFKTLALRPMQRISLKEFNPDNWNLIYENTLRSYISKMRKKLPDDLLKTQRNSGYYLNLKEDEILVK